MKLRRLLGGMTVFMALVAAVFLYLNHPVRASDHQDSPATLGRPGADITDPFLFPSTDPTKVVVVMNVRPLIPAGQGTTTYFDPQVLYQMKFDNIRPNSSGAPVENLVLQFAAGAPGPNQQIFVYGPSAPVVTGAANNQLVAQTGSGTINTQFSTSNGMTIFAGGREDPFFFDLAQFLKILPDRNAGSTAKSCLPTPLGGDNSCPQGFNPPSTASDTLANFNVLSFIVELPRTMLTAGGGPKIAYWTTTSTTSGQ